jgi:hypothetical protein
MANTSENRVHFSHTMPEHGSEIVHEGKWQHPSKEPEVHRKGNEEQAIPMQGVVFERRHVALLNKALRDPNHWLRDAALELMQGFTRAAERHEIITLNKASNEYHIPNKNLSEWVAKGLVPYESRDQYAIYVRRDMLDKVAPVYHHAKEQRKLAGPILRKMRDELFPESSISRQK